MRNLALVKAKAMALQLLAPGYSTCMRCNTPWKFADNRSVHYIGVTEEQRLAWWKDCFPDEVPPPRYKDRITSGIFALCTLCWDELTPEERLPYYEELWHRYARKINGLDQRTVDLCWEEIQTKILHPELELHNQCLS